MLRFPNLLCHVAWKNKLDLDSWSWTYNFGIHFLSNQWLPFVKDLLFSRASSSCVISGVFKWVRYPYIHPVVINLSLQKRRKIESKKTKLNRPKLGTQTTSRDMLWWRITARNVSFWISFRWPFHLVSTQLKWDWSKIPYRSASGCF